MSLDSIACDIFVDISGADCALPFSKLNDALGILQSGQTLMAVSSKQALINDIPAFCRQRELQLVGQGEADDMFYFLIKKIVGPQINTDEKRSLFKINQ